jgi:hypothetical protein
MVERDRPDQSLVLPEGSKRAPKRKKLEGPTTIHPPPAKRATNASHHTLNDSNSATKSPDRQENPPAAHSETPQIAPSISPISPTPPPPTNPTVSDPSRQPSVIVIDDDDDDKLKHRLQMPGRPMSSCVADHPHFKKKEALAYNFLVMENPAHEEDGTKLVSCQMSCAFCLVKGEKQSWKWSTKAKGSTGNFIQHFKNSHAKVWAARSAEDEAIRHPNRTQPSGDGAQQTTLDSWADRVRSLLKWRLLYYSP